MILLNIACLCPGKHASVVESKAVSSQLTVLCGDCLTHLKTLPDESVHTVVTSPPYYRLRDYGVAGQLGLEDSPAEYVARLVEVFREVRRVLRDDGTLWINLASSYAGTNEVGRKDGGGMGRTLGKSQPSRGKRRLNVIREDEPFALRDDLSSDELIYVLSELVTHVSKSIKIFIPDFAVSVDSAVAASASGEKV